MVSHRLQAEKSLFTQIAWVDDGKVTAGSALAMLKHHDIADFFGHEP